MTGLLDGAVAVVTGGAQGNGERIAHGLGAAGATVAVIDVDGVGAERVAASVRDEGANAAAWALDITDRDGAARVAAEVEQSCGPATVLVNNAGILRRVSATDADLLESIDVQLRVNVMGTMTMVHAFLPHLRRTRGRIVTVASIAAFVATAGGAGYGASKAALRQLTKVLAMELAPDGIRVNAIAPGVLVTPMTAEVREDPAKAAAFLSHTPLGRFGDPNELIGPVVFLSSDMSSYVTGVTLPVDGGYLVK